MLVKMQCPQCGANMDFDNDREFMFCAYCGAKIANIKEEKTITINQNVNGTVVYQRDTSNDPNLVIEYSTMNPNFSLMTVVNRERWVYPNGTNKTYRLEPGLYPIKFAVANKSWGREIYIPIDNTPVKIQVVFAGHVKIYIDQPKQGISDWPKIQKMRKQAAQNEKLAKQQAKQDEKQAKLAAKAEKKAAREAKKLDK